MKKKKKKIKSLKCYDISSSICRGTLVASVVGIIVGSTIFNNEMQTINKDLDDIESRLSNIESLEKKFDVIEAQVNDLNEESLKKYLKENHNTLKVTTDINSDTTGRTIYNPTIPYSTLINAPGDRVDHQVKFINKKYKFKKLKLVILENNYPKCLDIILSRKYYQDTVDSLTIKDAGEVDAKKIVKLNNVKSVKFINCDKIDNIDSLSDCSNIENIKIKNCGNIPNTDNFKQDKKFTVKVKIKSK